MTAKTVLSQLCVPLSDKQQELLTAGADFELTGSNFANRLANLQGTTNSGPNGSTANSTGQVTAINTAAQDLMALGGAEVPRISPLGSAPVLNGVGGGAGGAGGGE